MLICVICGEPQIQSSQRCNTGSYQVGIAHVIDMNFHIFQLEFAKKFLQFLHHKNVVTFIFPALTPEEASFGYQTNPMNIFVV